MRLLTILVLCAVAVGCGYGSHATMPAAPGTTPVITALNPSSATHGDAGFPLMVNGSSFGGSAFITFGGSKMATTWTNSGLVTAQIPSSAIMNAGPVTVTVTNPGTPGGLYGGGTQTEVSQPMTFTVN